MSHRRASYCTKCNHVNLARSAYCEHCGASLARPAGKLRRSLIVFAVAAPFLAVALWDWFKAIGSIASFK
jgi:hypothetical protein